MTEPITPAEVVQFYIEEKPHASTLMCVKEANVDDKMISLVAWFNKFQGVYTMNCCEGGELPPGLPEDCYEATASKPYIHFFTQTQHDMYALVEALQGLIHKVPTSPWFLTFEPQVMDGHITYCWRLPSHKYLLELNKVL